MNDLDGDVAGDPAAAAGAQRARGAGRDPPRGADLARRGGAAVGHLEADRVESRCGRCSTPAWCARPRRGRDGPELRRRVLRAGAGGGDRARHRHRRPLPARGHRRPVAARSARARTSSCTVPTRPACWRSWTRCAASLLEASRLGEHLVDSAVVGMPGVVGPGDEIGLAGGVAGLGGEGFTQALRDAAGRSRCRFENDVNLAALGEQWRGVAQGVDDFAVLSVGTGTGVGIVLRRRAAPRPPRRGGRDRPRLRRRSALDIDPCAAALEAYATPARPQLPRRDAAARRRTSTPAVFAAARAGDELAAQVVDGGGAADRGEHRADRRRGRRLAGRARRRHRRERRPAAGAGARRCWPDVAAVSADASASRASASRRCCTARSPRRCAARSTTSSAGAGPAAEPDRPRGRSSAPEPRDVEVAHRKRRGNCATMPADSMSAMFSAWTWIRS